ncbi:hypothetical protein FQN57_002949 [Myotisia sp. PD_48]|nr:hypothetical protein FQN57_002949 [Myotisia sp. PD_48]
MTPGSKHRGIGRRAALAILSLSLLAPFAQAKRPNVVFILTDDQDWHMGSLEHMPFLQKYLINEGTLYSNHFCTVALCCPSRVNLWTGKNAHNTNVTDIFPPYGGYPKIVQEGINDDYLPVWLQQAGYNTYYTGKLWNAHDVNNYNAPYAGGFNGSDILLDPFTYEYYNGKMSRNGGEPVSYKGQYSPDVVAEKAYGFLDEASMHSEPFFLGIAPIAPHSHISLDPFKGDMPKYHPRHAHLFKDYKIPRTRNFNPQEAMGWIATLPMLNDTVIAYNDEFQRARLRALQSVDEMVEQVVKILESKGILDNTYIFYTTDNGYHISQHRMLAGKMCGYETDVHIPLIVRGPGMAAGKVIQAATAHTNLAPTIMSLAQRTRDDFDALPIPFTAEEANNKPYEHVGIEYWGNAFPEGIYGFAGRLGEGGKPILVDGDGSFPNNTYKAVRLVGKGYNLYYSVWCTNEKEYYDMTVDESQMDNLAVNPDLYPSHRIAGRPYQQIVNRLDTLLMILKSCKTNECIEPWRTLHPDGKVLTLLDALRSEYDTFYAEQPRVSFTSCELGYFPAAEGPQNANIYNGGSGSNVFGQDNTSGSNQKVISYPGRRGHWSLWT